MNHSDFNPITDENDADPYNISFKRGHDFKNQDLKFKNERSPPSPNLISSPKS